ncbi:MAG: GDSL-type esterase/lipase family protein, partial [Verrucomicrobia bacterium]|nr:GDSL-type esterase/lipase family protein [Verrucomicrobiota bacterium]
DKGVLNESWKKHFANYRTINIGIGGDKAQNVLWRLDHGGVEGLQPKVVIVMIGNNNMFFAPETGVEAAAKGAQMCVTNVREKFPNAEVIAAKILPCHAPGIDFYENIKKTNAVLDTLKLDSDPKVQVLDLWSDFTNADGSIKKPLKPTPKTTDGKSLVYPYAPYNEGKLDPQLTGWPLTQAEIDWVTKGEYFRKPGHEAQKHQPDMWFVTPTAGHWTPKDGSTGNDWLEHHATCIEKVKAAGNIDIALIGDSITQGWGGGWDGAPFNAAWQKHFSDKKTVNLGIGGDRMEHLLWRLDHGALDGSSPKVIVLMIGVNNAPLVQANGVPVTAAVHGIKLCVENLRLRCPQSQIVLVKILPSFDPSKEVGKQVVNINALLDTLKLDADANIRALDLWSDFTNTDGTLKSELYSDKHLHLGPAGYEVFAAMLKPLLKQM